MNAILEIAAGILFFSAPPQEAMVYTAQDSASAEDLAKTAQAMSARCKAYGYKGVLAAPAEMVCRRIIQVTCETAITPEMKLTLDGFAQLSCSSVELRFPHPLTEIEKEQYQAGSGSLQETTPDGARWFRFRNPEDASVLLRDVPVILKSEILTRQLKDKSGQVQWSWEVNPLKSREILETERKSRLGVPYLLIDGWAIEAAPLTTLEKDDNGRIVAVERVGFAPTQRLVRVALAFPMPCSLRGGE